MVEGLAVFGEHFSAFTDNYVLIGGTACDLAMASEPLDLKNLKIKGVSQNELLDLLSKVYLP